MGDARREPRTGELDVHPKGTAEEAFFEGESESAKLVSIGVVGGDEKNELTRGGGFTSRDEMTREAIARRERFFRGALTDRDQNAIEPDAGLAELAMMREHPPREGVGAFLRPLKENDEVTGVGSEGGRKARTSFDDEQ